MLNFGDMQTLKNIGSYMQEWDLNAGESLFPC